MRRVLVAAWAMMTDLTNRKRSGLCIDRSRRRDRALVRWSLTLLALVSLSGGARADDAEMAPPVSYDAYVSQLAAGEYLVFASDCKMNNGDQAVMLFRQSDNFGVFFEMSGDRTVRSELLINRNGGYMVQTRMGVCYFDDRDGAVRALIELPYHVLVPYFASYILKYPSSTQCREQDFKR